jgi:hypothetical protein
MEQIERIREEIAIVIHFGGLPEITENFIIGKQDKADALKYWGGIANEILSLKLGSKTLKEWIELYEQGKLRIESANQDLPEMPKSAQSMRPDETYQLALIHAKHLGFVRCLPKEEQ